MATKQSLYILPVTENGEALFYYCIIILRGSNYSWMLSRESELLSYGEGDEADIELMLNSFSTDLSFSEDKSSTRWSTVTLH